MYFEDEFKLSVKTPTSTPRKSDTIPPPQQKISEQIKLHYWYWQFSLFLNVKTN